MNETLDELKKEATELGIKFNVGIGEEKLKAKIEEFYESQETKVEPEVEEINPVISLAKKSGKTMNDLASEAKARANKFVIVTILDNDQRVNSQTTFAPVNCSNQFFDLGTMHIPLNVAVEVRQGFIDVLREIKIPQHVKDYKTGLSTYVMRPRYSIV